MIPASPMRMEPHLAAIKHYNAQLLHQVGDLLRQLCDEELSTPRPLLFGATIGQHVRHVLECHALLLAQHHGGTINYDQRARDPRIETSVDHAQATVQHCLERMRAITTDRDLTLESGLPEPAGTIASRSSLLRELAYVADHCVHHLALVRIVLENELAEVALPKELGVAAATRNHRAR